ncbi:4a-hydroxytetrahydrobiopterin dehydratase [Aquirufa sp. OSTEICH-129A]
MSTWQEENQALIKTFVFDSFEEALRFMQLASGYIGQIDHHPTWTNTYNKIQISLNSHDAGHVVTQKDWDLAAYLDSLYQQFIPRGY